MPRQSRALAWICLTIGAALAPSGARADVLTQSVSIPLSPTDWGTSTAGFAGKDPLVLKQFDTLGGSRVLDSVDVAAHAVIRNDFSLGFITPATDTATVGTGNPRSPGPSITIYQPDGTTPIVAFQSPNDPASLTRTVTYGFKPGESVPRTFGSDLPPTSPFYLPPAITDLSSTGHLTTSAELAQFTGSGTLALPVTAAAFASITLGSGNGSGMVTTNGAADVTLTYTYHNAALELVPEPGTLLLWGVAGMGLLGLSRRPSRARRSVQD